MEYWLFAPYILIFLFIMMLRSKLWPEKDTTFSTAFVWLSFTMIFFYMAFIAIIAAFWWSGYINASIKVGFISLIITYITFLSGFFFEGKAAGKDQLFKKLYLPVIIIATVGFTYGVLNKI